jgi:hypothetical protein
MGLLDDAIREHLELKRLRGANPGDVARLERDAFGSTPAKDASEAEQDEPSTMHEPVADTGEPAIGQETVEINMEAELASAGEVESTDAKGHPAEQDSLEWEMPGDHREPEDQIKDEAEPVEDVLEETPDFLQETPDQERLWFEQRPPRDFDFNE